MNTPWTDEALAAASRLLTAEPGATVTITDLAGDVVFHAPLARSIRRDDISPTVAWIRPVAGRCTPPGDPSPRYRLTAARRCSLTTTRPVVITAGRLDIDLEDGSHAVLAPAHRPGDVNELQDWDTFVLTVLSVDDEAALDALSEDSWHGPHA